jgi:hypothetical protein
MGLAIGFTNSDSMQSDCLHLAGDWVAHNDSMRAYQFIDSVVPAEVLPIKMSVLA